MGYRARILKMALSFPDREKEIQEKKWPAHQPAYGYPVAS